jgi:hypothetical protein
VPRHSFRFPVLPSVPVMVRNYNSFSAELEWYSCLGSFRHSNFHFGRSILLLELPLELFPAVTRWATRAELQRSLRGTAVGRGPSKPLKGVV